MIRKFALVSAIVAGTLSAGALAAQTAAPTKPTATPSMQHTQTPPAAKQDTGAKAASKTAATHHAAWTKDQIKEAQEGLIKAGLYKGQATGVFNADTRKALKEYQKQNKLRVTGRLSDSTLAKLKTT
ncbi:MAG TPA: peptidoglycan-binding domain-containing protein [Gemmatimonadales bacterium]|jgi:peptidoglycan hydrolase-like protein with peptidoglycan-binding domain|nr:peptidoglycan-binding domain-containing protein [Gemmatimonadales bacterium]